MLQIFKKYYPLRNIFFVAGEAIFIYISLLLATMISLGSDTFFPEPQSLMKLFLTTAVYQACLYYNDLYDLKILDSLKELSVRLLRALGFVAIFLALFNIVLPIKIIETGIFLNSICHIII